MIERVALIWFAAAARPEAPEQPLAALAAKLQAACQAAPGVIAARNDDPAVGFDLMLRASLDADADQAFADALPALLELELGASLGGYKTYAFERLA